MPIINALRMPTFYFEFALHVYLQLASILHSLCTFIVSIKDHNLAKILIMAEWLKTRLWHFKMQFNNIMHINTSYKIKADSLTILYMINELQIIGKTCMKYMFNQIQYYVRRSNIVPQNNLLRLSHLSRKNALNQFCHKYVPKPYARNPRCVSMASGIKQKIFLIVYCQMEIVLLYLCTQLRCPTSCAA